MHQPLRESIIVIIIITSAQFCSSQAPGGRHGHSTLNLQWYVVYAGACRGTIFADRTQLSVKNTCLNIYLIGRKDAVSNSPPFLMESGLEVDNQISVR